MGPDEPSGPPPFTDPHQPSAADGADDPCPESLRPRPFLQTWGRARGTDESIAPETQVVSTDFGYTTWNSLSFERRDIVVLCGTPLSVVEICGQLSLHVGVVRVLVGDLASEGYLQVHVPDEDATHNVDTILRVIHGLRAIS